MLYFSKSKYTAFKKCEKLCWLQKYKPEERKIDAEAQARFARGTEVGELARGLFGAYKDATVVKIDGSLDLNAMKTRTATLVATGAENICEAAFSYNGLYCAVDILHKQGDGYAIYEVKSSTSLHEYYVADLAYQKYVVQNCGVNVVGAYLILLNGEYRRHGALDIHKLFAIEDISDRLGEEIDRMDAVLSRAETVMNGPEPPTEIGIKCAPSCDYWKYCTRGLPSPSVFDLYSFPGKWDCYAKGIVTFSDVLSHGVPLTFVQKMQIEHALADKLVYVNKEGIKAFLSTLTYPLYFLDFETMQMAVPEFEGAKPNEQIPFQYSLHRLTENGELGHTEFLAESGIDPRRKLAERLCEDFPQDVCTLAYNSKFECGVISRLAEVFPDLAPRLTNIKEGIVDLLPVFRNGYYYNRAMGGSFSMKSVLPAVYPDMDYHNLDTVQNGIDAMLVFPKIKDMPPEEAERTRAALLEYCERDTLAMVMLLRELIRVANK